MKFAALALVFGAAVFVTATPKLAKRADCQRCNDIYNICVRNGYTEGQIGCKITCRDRACDQEPGCREQCGGDFTECASPRRWHN